MKCTTVWRVITVLIILSMVAPLVQAAPAQQPPPPDAKSAPQDAPTAYKGEPEVERQLPPVSYEAALAKLDPYLREMVTSVMYTTPEGMQMAVVAEDQILVHVLADPGEGTEAALAPYFDRLLALPSVLAKKGVSIGQQQFIGLIAPAQVNKIIFLPQVTRVFAAVPERAEYEPYPADDTAVQPGPQDWETLRANAAKLREGSPAWQDAKAFGDGRALMQPMDWFEMSYDGPAKAQAAWDRGYRGEGVAISVIDDGVDFAHPDLMGTQKIYSSTVAPQYNGWPYIMDPFTMRAYFYDLWFGTTYVANGFEGATYFDTSATPELTPCGVDLLCFQYTPLLAYGVLDQEYTYFIDSKMTKSGVVHVGTHHDGSLRDYVWGERVAVLVTDPNVAGVYDTVYVDLDANHDFRDEKPVTKADPHDPDTYNNPIAYRDMNGDGKADLSGGLLYFIADGVNHVPGMDWLYALDLLGIAPPANGSLIAMHGPWDSGYSHGTNCASNAVGRGQIDGMLPSFSDLPGDGKPAAAVYGAAPEADLVAMNNGWYFTGYVNAADAYFLAAIGWDGVDQTGFHFLYGYGPWDDSDAIMATSNSYGWSADFNDGWDYHGQLIEEIQRNWAPHLQFLFSTGNGGPGYGTVAPPSPGLGIAVGASTEYGSTGWDSITETTQINFNDVAAFSNSGPSARQGAGVDVLAGGAFAAGSEELNYYAISSWGVLDGNISWATWGGTSRSAPTALGVLALIYQAYHEAHGVWPTHEQAKAILMSTATHLEYDVFKQGAGAVNADQGTAVAGGHYGLYAEGSAPTWSPGDYRGDDFGGFAHIAYPGETYAKTFDLRNSGAQTVTADVRAVELELIQSEEFDFTVTPEMVAAQSAYGAANRDNFYKAFQFFIPITATAGVNDAWYNIAIPPDTDLMVVRQIFPYDQFDVNGDYNWDQRYYLMVYNWKDVNGNGIVWDDKDGNGVVNIINSTEWTSVDVGPELAWDDPRTELDRWEFARFGYNRPSANVNELMVHDPLGRMHDGLFIGLRHLYTSLAANITTTLSYRIEFYREGEVDWLEVGGLGGTVVLPDQLPPGADATFVATATLPTDMPPGDYGAAIQIGYDGWGDYAGDTVVIPVVLNVAADFENGLQLGGQTAYDYDAERPYNNGAVRGYFDWGWREESGDWRFFYVDIQNEPVEDLIWKEDFDGGSFPPSDWTVVDNTGNGGWATNTTWGEDNYTGGAGEAATVSSDVAGWVEIDTELRTPPFDLPTGSAAALKYVANYQNLGDYFDVDISTDGGVGWTNLLRWNDDFGDFHGPSGVDVEIDLSAYMGMTGLMLRWRYYDANWAWYVQIDDVEVVLQDYPFDPTAHVIVKDEWASAAPHTDIDTIVLGPTPSQMDDIEFGVWAADFRDPSYYGPYTLDTVAQSVDDRAGRSIWRFNTTSGANEEWLTFSIQDGLHEILQHNVLFEGDQFDVVFTKTMGLLTEDVHEFDIETYVDTGVLGSVMLESTIGLNGLVADGYLIAPEITQFTNEPLGFAGPGLIEWVDVFTVEDGVSIEAWTSSPNVPDLDLFLYWWNGAAWQRMAYSAGADANEYVYVPNPPDGDWLVGIDNYSGPAGHFNMTRIVERNVGGISVTGATTDAVAANTPVTLTVHYDYPLEPGLFYSGLMLVGPPEAPELKQIPISIYRLPESAMVEKEAQYGTVFAGLTFDYMVDLYNLSDPAAHFEFNDPLPAEVEFVATTFGVYDPDSHSVVYTGTLPLGAIPPQAEGFEGGVVPPLGWTEQATTAYNWSISTGYRRTGTYGAYVPYDYNQNEWLLSPRLLGLTGGEHVSLWSMGSYYWGVAPYDNYDVNVWLVVGGLGGANDVLLGNVQDDWPTTSWTWVQSVFTLPTTLPTGDLRIGFQYVGDDGADVGIDDILLPGTPAPLPSESVEITVRVTDTVQSDTYFTNTATLLATHFMPQGDEMEPAVHASATVHVGAYAITGTKTAPAQAATGDRIRYDIIVTNIGDEAADVKLLDVIPAGATYYNHAGPAHFVYSATLDAVMWEGLVAPDDELTFMLWVDVDEDPDMWGTDLVNTAELAAGSPGSALYPAGDLVATTAIIPPSRIYLPLVMRNG
ncbi:MAG TPA: hypothetical protein ENN99_12655 [Chloroflexi bacterium]|nr:hypothetical protein [Chloroflexota bacterium]